MQILSSLHFPQLLKIFKKGCFPALHQSYWPMFPQHFEKKLVEGLKIRRTTRHEESEFLSKEPSHTCQFYMKEAALTSPEENSMQFHQLFVSWFRVKCMEILGWFLALTQLILYCTLKSYNLGNERTHIPRTWLLFFNPWTR